MINRSKISLVNSKKSLISGNSPQNISYPTLNLSQLLDHKVTPPSESIMRDRLFSQRSRRTQDQSKNNNQDSNTTKPYKRIPLKINYQHYRSKSSSKIKNYYDSIKSPYQKKVDLKNLSDPTKSLILFKSNSQIISPQVKGVCLQNSFKSHQLSSKNSFKNQNYVFRQELYASQKSKESEAILIMSLEYKKNSEQKDGKEREAECKGKVNYKYLKKGSSLQKQIVINLLKNKIIKEHQENTKKQYTQHDILNMVKLYKGFLSFPKSAIKNPQLIRKPKVDSNSKSKFIKQNSTFNNEEFLRTYQSLPERIVQKQQKYPKPIVGWETSTQFDIEELKNQQHTQITMDHSWGF